jgi:PAS domain S-box-containing protein
MMQDKNHGELMNILFVQSAHQSDRTLSTLVSSSGGIQIDGVEVLTLDDAQSQLNSMTFDVILLDICGSKGSESEGLHRLSQIQRFNQNQIPIIVMVGHDHEELALKALESGADDYLFPEKLDGWLVSRIVQQVKKQNAIAAELDATQQAFSQSRQPGKKSLQNAPEQLAAILDLATDAIISIDADQRITLFNQGAVKIFGYPASEAIGQPLDILLPARVAEIHHQYVSRFVQSGDTKRLMGTSLEIVARRQDGSEFPAEASISKVIVEQETISTVILRDISDRKQAELSLDQSRDELEKRVVERTAELEAVNEALRSEIRERHQAEQVLQDILVGTASVTGTEFFPALVQHLAQALGVRYAFAGTAIASQPGQLRIIAGWNGDKISEIFDDAIAKTPCEMVSRTKKLCYYPDLQEQFPEDAHLREMEVVSYMGLPLLDSQGEAIGHLCILDDRPLVDPERTESLLTVFAARATAELQRQQAQDQLQQAKEQLEIRVQERTAELSTTLQNLEQQMAERQRIQLELLVANEHLQHLLTSSPAIIFSCNAEENYPIAFISENVKTILGYDAQEFIDDRNFWINHVHPEDVDLLFKKFPGFVRLGSESQEYRLQHKDGSYRWLYGEMKLVYDPANNPVECVGYWIDITDRKQTEVALEKERQQLRQIVTHVPVAMAMFDREMRYIAYSNQWLTDYQLTSSDNPPMAAPLNPPLIPPLKGGLGVRGINVLLDHPQRLSLEGQSHYDIFPNLPQRYKTMYQQALQGEVISLAEDLFERSDGSQIYQRLAIQPWYAVDGTIGGIVIASYIINELVEAREAALEVARIKSEFLANMSHEIRTPMNGILGMTELLAQTEMTPQQQDFLKTLKTSGETLLFIINDILDFSKLDSGHMSLENLEFNLENTLDDLLDLFALSSRKKGLELVGLLWPTLPVNYQGDPNRIRQILSNLINNAIKFTESGSVTLEVFSNEADETQNHPETINLTFQVKDTGIGIPLEKRHKLFKSFCQVDASHTREYGGTGLGLAICKKLLN